MDKLNLDKTNLKKFSIIISVTLTIIGTILLLKHKESYIGFYSSGILLFLLGIFVTNLLKPIYIIWMGIAYVLAWINTRLILMIIFYSVFTPIGLAMRLFRIDLLERRIDKYKKSYWKTKEKREFNQLNYERQF